MKIWLTENEVPEGWVNLDVGNFKNKRPIEVVEFLGELGPIEVISFGHNHTSSELFHGLTNYSLSTGESLPLTVHFHDPNIPIVFDIMVEATGAKYIDKVVL